MNTVIAMPGYSASTFPVGLFGGFAPSEDRIDKAPDAVRDRFGEDAIVRGRGFGIRLVRHGPSKVE